MDLILTVIQVVLPVFGLAGVGFLWVRLGFEFRLEFVTRLAMSLAVPCLVFTSLMKTKIDPGALSAISFAAIASYLVVIVASFALLRVLGLSTRTYLAPLFGGNTGNLGLPLALFAFGAEGLAYAVVVFAIMAIISFTYGVWLVAGGGNFWRIFREPLVGATILGALFLVNGWQTPAPLTNTLDLIGQMAIPLMLLTLGVAIARLRVPNLTRAVWLSLAKAVICITASAAVGLGFGLPPVALAVLVLQVSTPVAVTSYMLAAKYGADADAVAGLVVISTLLSIAILPITLAFLL